MTFNFIGAHAGSDNYSLALTLTSAPTPGDFDGDGAVDGDDFLAWQTGFGIPAGATRADGDADLDGDVDGNDFLIWQSNFGSDAGHSAGPSVPEPTSLAVAALLAMAMNCGVARSNQAFCH